MNGGRNSAGIERFLAKDLLGKVETR